MRGKTLQKPGSDPRGSKPMFKPMAVIMSWLVPMGSASRMAQRASIALLILWMSIMQVASPKRGLAASLVPVISAEAATKKACANDLSSISLQLLEPRWLRMMMLHTRHSYMQASTNIMGLLELRMLRKSSGDGTTAIVVVPSLPR